MNFFSSVFTKVQETLNLSANFTVTEVTNASLENSEVLMGNSFLELHKYVNPNTDPRFALVLTTKSSPSKHYRLFILEDEEQSVELFRVYDSNLLPLLSVVQSLVGSATKLQDVCNAIRSKPAGSVVHICVELGLLQVLQSKHPDVISYVNQLDAENSTPLHIASKNTDVSVDLVQQLVYLGADMGARDAHGETPITLCARYSPEKLKALLHKPTEAINVMTIYGETAVHIACQEDQVECLRILLEAGADPTLSESHQLPIHCAVRANSVRCIEMLVKHRPDVVKGVDGKFGGTALHWAKTKEVIDCLLENNCPIDAKSNSQDTALHIMLKAKRVKCVAALLVMGADVSIPNHEGETPLHLSILADDRQTAMGLVIHGADVNLVDRNGRSPRHLAATSSGANSPEILYMLHKIGADRCEKGQEGCDDGCKYNGKYRGKKFGCVDKEREEVERACDEILTSGTTTNRGANSSSANSMTNSKTMDGGYTSSDSAASSTQSLGGSADSIGSGLDVFEKIEDAEDGYRVLCLDGGGIRGLILAITLMKLERMLEGNIVDYFDWISGTSTGGMLALGLAYGMDARYCLGLYLRLKSQVFAGSKPYSAETFEKILQQEFGPDTPMTALQKPKVIVTAVLADRHPPDLYLFKNYVNPLDAMVPLEKRLSPCHTPTPKPEEVKVWEAARSSGAAPTYFRAGLNKFLDGGLMANNPTLDTLTEIYEYNAALKAMAARSSDSSMRNQEHLVKPIKCVMSIGTGRIPKCAVCDIDVFRPSGIMEAYKVMQGAQSLMRILVEQATQSEGRVNERARAWCASIGSHFFRLSPQLSEDVLLDETNDDKLLLMCWETLIYLHRNRDRLQKIVSILKPNKGKPRDVNEEPVSAAAAATSGSSTESINKPEVKFT